jgi:hypothetical protein
MEPLFLAFGGTSILFSNGETNLHPPSASLPAFVYPSLFHSPINVYKNCLARKESTVKRLSDRHELEEFLTIKDGCGSSSGTTSASSEA